MMDKGDLRIERLQQYLDRQKGVVENNIKGYSRELEKNYLYFFGWHADDLYKAHYVATNYNAIQETVDTAKSPKEIEAYLNKCILYVEDDLLNGPLVKRSTSPMSNISHSLEMECKQKLLKDFHNLNRILQSEAVSERIRPQEAPKREIAPPKEKKKTGPRLR
ncbi:hypothetical protein [Bacteroides fragilis]|uniref:hypothetical protein n=1 Tax=Bacteroides fragilis TaxID=817 RepID=UPI00281254DA|nr:hypothetical protein [Bacteroides fragilis]WMI93998.1 hypothetical protein BFGS084_01408 [Bacteroides fragilis]